METQTPKAAPQSQSVSESTRQPRGGGEGQLGDSAGKSDPCRQEASAGRPGPAPRGPLPWPGSRLPGPRAETPSLAFSRTARRLTLPERRPALTASIFSANPLSYTEAGKGKQKSIKIRLQGNGVHGVTFIIHRSSAGKKPSSLVQGFRFHPLYSRDVFRSLPGNSWLACR